jgi:hypothetical protein
MSQILPRLQYSYAVIVTDYGIQPTTHRIVSPICHDPRLNLQIKKLTPTPMEKPTPEMVPSPIRVWGEPSPLVFEY